MGVFVVGIGGGTASGKTTLAALVAARVGAALIAHDRYYYDAPDAARVNFDHPDALETNLLVDHLDRLRAGHPVDLPVYDFATHRRVPRTDRVEPSGLVIVEGILVLGDARLRRRFDLTAAVIAPPDVRLMRRVRRDCAERGRTVESVFEQYMAQVRPMHERFVEPHLQDADVLLDGLGVIEEQAGRLLARLPI